MDLALRVGVCVGFCLFYGLSFAAPGRHPAFDQRLSEAGLVYSPPSGFIDDGPNVVLEKELSKTLESSKPFVVHQIRSSDQKIAAYVDIRVLGIDLNSTALAIGYPIVFESNAAEYCALVSGGPCRVYAKLPSAVVQTDYHADLGMILKAERPRRSRLVGHKAASVIAISKPSRGLIYTTILYDSDAEFDKAYEGLKHMLTFE